MLIRSAQIGSSGRDVGGSLRFMPPAQGQGRKPPRRQSRGAKGQQRPLKTGMIMDR